jgi:hypothetical protein
MVDALTAAMAMVPMLYSRNRMFERFTDPVIRRARSRARMVRGLLRFIAREDAVVKMAQVHDKHIVTHRIPKLRFERTVQLTEIELALLRMLLSTGPHPSTLDEQETDRPRVEAALALLPKEAA